MAKTPGLSTVSTKRQRIAELAKQMTATALTSLSQHIDIDWMREAYERTRKDGATGVDGQTAAEYAANLEDNLRSLLDRAKSGDRYRAPAVRRVYIPKGDGTKLRPIGIPTFEDKVLQKAVVMALEPVYEQDFLDCSYGFRPGRSAHQALEVLWHRLMEVGGGWVYEADIEAFFDSVDKTQLQEVVRQRVRDGVLLRLIGKWLRAGVSEDGRVYCPETGTPQGGVISPLLANIFLHEVLDAWFEREVKPQLQSEAHLVRYADDFVIVFARRDDAERVLEVLPKRFGQYGLRLHPEKSRLLRFKRPPKRPGASGGGEPDSFDLLGFTHFWGRSRKGSWVVQRRTAKDRFRRALSRISAWCRDHRHESIAKQHETLSRKLKGHDAYYGITSNCGALKKLRHAVERVWFKWLRSRSGHAHQDWKWMTRVLERWPLPRARVVHSALPCAANP